MDEISVEEPRQCEHTCSLTYCRSPRTRYVYGLYDSRTANIFYVGSTFDATNRFSEHLREHPYVQGMLARGILPLPMLLCEFTTLCDSYSRQIEVAIARQLRKMGHSAFSDDTSSARTVDGWFYTMVEEQAQQCSHLCDIWRE